MQTLFLSILYISAKCHRNRSV